MYRDDGHRPSPAPVPWLEAGRRPWWRRWTALAPRARPGDAARPLPTNSLRESAARRGLIDTTKEGIADRVAELLGCSIRWARELTSKDREALK